MKLSNGLTRTAPTVGMFVLYGLSFLPMTIALKQMEIGTVYAIWSAVGTAFVAVLGVLLFHEPANALKVVAIMLIITGVVCLDLSTRQASQTVARTQSQLRSELRPAGPLLLDTNSVAAPKTGSASVGPATGP